MNFSSGEPTPDLSFEAGMKAIFGDSGFSASDTDFNPSDYDDCTADEIHQLCGGADRLPIAPPRSPADIAAAIALQKIQSAQSAESYARHKVWVVEENERRRQQREIDALLEAEGKLITYGDGAAILETFDRIEGLIPMRGRVGILGMAKAGKSVMSTALGMHIATGMSLGDRFVEQGCVLHVMSEGDAKQNKNRIIAWCKEHDVSPRAVQKNYIALDANYLLSEDPKVLLDDIYMYGGKNQDGTPRIKTVIVDPLINNFQGDENSAKDMMQFMTNIQIIEKEIAGVTIVPHHVGKDGSKGARGSSVFMGALDAELKVTNKKGVVTLQTTLSRDTPGDASVKGEIRSHVHGVNPRGVAVTSPVVVFVSPKVGEENIIDGDNHRNQTGPEIIKAAMRQACLSQADGDKGGLVFTNRYMTRTEIRDAIQRHLSLDTSKQTVIDKLKNMMTHLKAQAKKPDGVVECFDFDVKTNDQTFRLRIQP